ncbi:MAG: ATP-dependent helicase [Lachnospiraceae bacterium]|nr:ATP-dependent helicase [Lachnospiraceae bacterium]
MKLNKEQYIAAHHVNGPMLVLAGPGSGKTHLLVERIRLMVEENLVPAESILVITFSKKAAEEMKVRFNRRTDPKHYDVTFGTFHAVFYHILLEDDPHVGRLITEDEQTAIVIKAMEPVRGISELFDPKDPESIPGMISAYKNHGKEFFERNEFGRRMSEQERSGFEKTVAGYEALCRQEGVIDFDDMIILCERLLYRHEKVLRKWQERFRYFLVDEFQDINEGQYKVLRLLAGDSMNVFAVGDDDQSIYAFRGSSPALMKRFVHQYRGCRQVTLTMNYRCCENVIGAADSVIRHNTERFDRPMQRHLPSKSGGIVELVQAENSDIQAEFVCDMIDHLANEAGYGYSDIAILYRSDHCVKMFENKAEARGIRIDHAQPYTPKEKKIYEAYVRAYEHTADRADFFLIMNNPPRGLSRESLANTTGDYLSDMKMFYAGEPDKLEAVGDLERTIARHGCMPPPCPAHCATHDSVRVMTAHASKGLEFKCVFIIGLQEGLFPHYKNLTGTGAQEERRLMYVAMTRAKERLYMCTIGSEHGKRPSRFADEAVENRHYIKDILKLTAV